MLSRIIRAGVRVLSTRPNVTNEKSVFRKEPWSIYGMKLHYSTNLGASICPKGVVVGNLREFIDQGIASSQIRGSHNSDKERCVLIDLFGNVMWEIYGYHLQNKKIGNLSLESVIIYKFGDRYYATLSDIENGIADESSKDFDIYQAGLIFEFILDAIFEAKNITPTDCLILKDRLLLDPNNRPTADMVNQDSVFWTNTKRAALLRDLSNFFQARLAARLPVFGIRSQHTDYKSMEALILKGIDWHTVLPAALKEMEGYYEADLLDFMRIFRNVDMHIDQIPPNIQALFPKRTHEEVLALFCYYYPELIPRLTTYVQTHLRHLPRFRVYV